MGTGRRQRRGEAKHIPSFWVLPGTEMCTGEPFPSGSWSCLQPCEIQEQNNWSVKKYSQWKHKQAATKGPLYSLRSSIESDFSHKIVCTSMSHLGRKGKHSNPKEQSLYLICWLPSWKALVSLTFAYGERIAMVWGFQADGWEQAPGSASPRQPSCSSQIGRISRSLPLGRKCEW